MQWYISASHPNYEFAAKTPAHAICEPLSGLDFLLDRKEKMILVIQIPTGVTWKVVAEWTVD